MNACDLAAAVVFDYLKGMDERILRDHRACYGTLMISGLPTPAFTTQDPACLFARSKGSSFRKALEVADDY
jgi:hypothetical protein